MKLFLLYPPVAFIIILLLGILLSAVTKILALKGAGHPDGKLKCYACGEEASATTSRPNYGQFFPFAFFFTIMHVVVLVMATIPDVILQISGVAVLFAVMALAALFILLRR
jgi:NADH:ubiquinone oxidoreductase subunit 3 (subunit A)